jgi:hypothetical protein
MINIGCVAERASDRIRGMLIASKSVRESSQIMIVTGRDFGTLQLTLSITRTSNDGDPKSGDLVLC